MRALVTGATGFIGGRLLEKLTQPAVLSRAPELALRRLGNKVGVHGWDPAAGPAPAQAFAGVDTVFHLAGEPVAEGRWTAAKKQRIRQSRVEGTRNLVAAIESLPERPKILVSASAVGFYGDRGDEMLEETSAPGQDFLAGVCREWEAEALRAASLGIRVVTARIGLVLGPSGGALARMLTPFKLGLGGRLSSGRQWMPWVHLDDLVGLLLHAAGNAAISGAMNAVGPAPVTNREFTETLATVLNRPAIFPVPAFAIRLMFGEVADVLLGSQRVLPKVAERTGYRFRYPMLPHALRAAIE
jgi:uncharacterized protein (TIGR01777 family)